MKILKLFSYVPLIGALFLISCNSTYLHFQQAVPLLGDEIHEFPAFMHGTFHSLGLFEEHEGDTTNQNPNQSGWVFECTSPQQCFVYSLIIFNPDSLEYEEKSGSDLHSDKILKVVEQTRILGNFLIDEKTTTYIDGKIESETRSYPIEPFQDRYAYRIIMFELDLANSRLIEYGEDPFSINTPDNTDINKTISKQQGNLFFYNYKISENTWNLYVFEPTEEGMDIHEVFRITGYESGGYANCFEEIICQNGSNSYTSNPTDEELSRILAEKDMYSTYHFKRISPGSLESGLELIKEPEHSSPTETQDEKFPYWFVIIFGAIGMAFLLEKVFGS